MLKTYIGNLQPKRVAESVSSKIELWKYEDRWSAFKAVAYRSDLGPYWATVEGSGGPVNVFYQEVINNKLYVQR